jgi:L-lactate dehydrogenase complex protein LldF
MAIHQPVDFENNVSRALKDTQLIRNIQSAMDTLVLKRKTVFSDAAEIEKLRALGNSIKTNALGKLPELLQQLEEKCTANGIQVHWAETIPEANQLVLDIMKSHGATRLVKGKSMVSEEM